MSTTNEEVKEEKGEIEEKVYKWLGLYFPQIEDVMAMKYSSAKMKKLLEGLEQGQGSGRELLSLMADISSIFILQEAREIKKIMKDEIKRREDSKKSKTENKPDAKEEIKLKKREG